MLCKSTGEINYTCVGVGRSTKPSRRRFLKRICPKTNLPSKAKYPPTHFLKTIVPCTCAVNPCSRNRTCCATNPQHRNSRYHRSQPVQSKILLRKVAQESCIGKSCRALWRYCKVPEIVGFAKVLHFEVLEGCSAFERFHRAFRK